MKLLRPYQKDAFDAVLSSFQEFTRVLVSLPCGTGKTVLFSHLAKHFVGLNKKVLILAHTEKLVGQAVEKLRDTVGVIAEVEKAMQHASREVQVVVACVPTMQRDRLLSWPESHFDLVIADEAHHSLAQSWMDVLTHFMSGGAKIVGFTATPDRSDKKQLGSFYECVAYEKGLIACIKEGHLSKIVIKSVPLAIDLNAVKVTAGDFQMESAAHALDPLLPSLAAEIAKEIRDRSCTIVFLPLIETSKKMAACLRAEGICALHVDGEDPDRAEKLAAAERGEIQCLTNAQLLTEGVDIPCVDCIVPLRPTKSRPAFCQQVGRGTRLFPGKLNCKILDFLWLHEKHNVAQAASLIAAKEEEAEYATKEARTKDGEVDLFAMEQDIAALREEQLRKLLKEAQKRKSKAISIEEVAVNFGIGHLATFEPLFPAQMQPASEKQLACIAKFGVDVASVRNKGHASALMNVLMMRSKRKLATPKQVKYLIQRGAPNPMEMTLKEASDFLDKAFAARSR